MNERIKEFINECETTYTDRYDRSYVEFDKQKFSELLIKECASITENKYKYNKEPNRWNSGFEISCDILEHFGIK